MTELGGSKYSDEELNQIETAISNLEEIYQNKLRKAKARQARNSAQHAGAIFDFLSAFQSYVSKSKKSTDYIEVDPSDYEIR